ncbi:MAG: formate dehydrogenase accessory protein FdhE [Acidobacteriota bacterium]
MASPSPRAGRADTREIVELKALAAREPALEAAASLQVELLESQRRVLSRITTPWIDVPDAELQARLATGRRLLDFDALPVDWTEVRLLFRQATDVLRRYDAIEAETAEALHAVGRGPALPDLAARWYGPSGSGLTSEPADATGDRAAPQEASPEMLDDVLAWALRPFLTRAAEVLTQRVSLAAWRQGSCPICGGDPALAVLTSAGERVLCCGRCAARWPFDSIACPFCGEASRDRITSFATPDGLYRVAACQTCRRYLKALDGRTAGRPILPGLDAIATLPLDAVVMQKGFTGG